MRKRKREAFIVKPETPPHLAALTPKELRFVQEYLIDLNASAAAIRAGYKPGRHNAARLMAKDHIAAAVAFEEAERSKRVHVDQDRVLLELSRLGFADIRKIFETRVGREPITGIELYLKTRAPGDERAFEALPREARAAWHSAAAMIPPVTGGFYLKSPDAIDDATAAAIAGIEVVTKSIGDGEVEYIHKIKFIEKTGPLNLMGRHLGMWSGKVSPPLPKDPARGNDGGGDTAHAGGVVIYLPDNGRQPADVTGKR